MFFLIIVCGRYEAEASLRGTLVDAVRVCRLLEEQAYRLGSDTYRRIVLHGGEIVGDSEGPLRTEGYGSPPYDAATATGMYDG
jgi:hypothetical protein